MFTRLMDAARASSASAGGGPAGKPAVCGGGAKDGGGVGAVSGRCAALGTPPGTPPGTPALHPAAKKDASHGTGAGMNPPTLAPLPRPPFGAINPNPKPICACILRAASARCAFSPSENIVNPTASSGGRFGFSPAHAITLTRASRSISMVQSMGCVPLRMPSVSSMRWFTSNSMNPWRSRMGTSPAAPSPCHARASARTPRMHRSKSRRLRSTQLLASTSWRYMFHASSLNVSPVSGCAEVGGGKPGKSAVAQMTTRGERDGRLRVRGHRGRIAR